MPSVSTPTPNLAEQTSHRLRRSAAAHARSALVNVTTEDDQVRGVIDAGIAVEHMAKAMLAMLHPALLADRTGDLDTLLHLTGFGQLSKVGTHEIKTVGAHEACQRVARLVPGFTYHQQADKALFDARNSGAHFALTTDEVARQSARLMVRLLEPLIKVMDLTRAEFWQDMEGVANTLLDETINQIIASLEMKIAASRRRLEARLTGLGDAERATVVDALTAHPFGYAEEEEPWECPACTHQGVISCEVHDRGTPEFEYEQVDVDHFVYHGGYIDRVALGTGFTCDACGLDLDYDEMEAAELPSEFEREPRECEPWEFEYDRD